MNINYFKNILAKFKSVSDRDNSKVLSNPNTAWKVLFFSFLLVNILIGVFSFYIFYQISQENIFVVVDSGGNKVNTIDKKKLSEAILYLEEKDENYKFLLKNKPVIIDPSR